MPTISIVASGTRGDVQPYIALGKGLKDAGYGVRVLTNENFESLVTGAGLTFCPVGDSIEALIQTDEWRKTIEDGNVITLFGRMQTEMKKRGSLFAEKLPGYLAGSDLVLTGMAGINGAMSIADTLEIPLMLAMVFPFTPTRAFAGPLVPPLPVGGPLNRLSFHVMRQMFWQSSKAGDVAVREALGLNKAPILGPFRALDDRRVPMMYGYSWHVLPRPADWPEHHTVTGYWFLDETPDWTPPPDLIDFLNAGAPPVYIGFGSMGSRNPEEAGAIALEALSISGQRGILATGWGGLNPSELPSTVHLISAIPHSWLFPRVAAAIHHGGAGTTAAGLRAGIPNIVVPFMADQPFWGRRVAELGAGPAPIPRKALTGKRLAAAITQAVTDVEMQRKARELGVAIRAEDGIANAVALVNRHMGV